MKKLFASMLGLSLVIASLALPVLAADKREVNRVKESGVVLQEILGIPDNIPADLLKKATCVVVLPSVKKLAIGIGGSYGRGVMTCRGGSDFKGRWSSPSMVALEGGNIGFQLGGQATDFVILVMNDRGVDSLLSSKVKLGADASAAAGPKGRTAAAATDAWMRAEMLSYSRARGLFAGISLEGSTLRPDPSANEKLYGRSIAAKEIVREGKAGMPASAATLIAALNRAVSGGAVRKKKK